MDVEEGTKNKLAERTTKYATGHKPREDFQTFMARIKANCTFPEDQSTQHPPAKLSKAARRVLAFAETLDDLECLRDLVARRRLPVLIRGKLYGVARTRFGWSLTGLDGHERQLNVDATTCSCEDNRFRHHTCKHMEALKCFCHPS